MLPWKRSQINDYIICIFLRVQKFILPLAFAYHGIYLASNVMYHCNMQGMAVRIEGLPVGKPAYLYVYLVVTCPCFSLVSYTYMCMFDHPKALNPLPY